VAFDFDESYEIPWHDDWFGDFYKFLMRDLVRYSDENLPQLRAEIIEWAKCIGGRVDEFKDAPWCRFPRDLVWNGHWAQMTGGERRVFGSLLALVDPRSLVTYATLKTIGEKAGLSEDRTSRALTALKKRGLVRRWPSRKSGFEVWFTRLTYHAMHDTPDYAASLKQRVVPAGRF